MAEYRRKLEEYTLARGKYEAEADAYWSSIADKRKLRRVKRRNNQDIALGDYVLTQPPVYSGPPKRVDPSAPPEEAPPRKYVPVVADFLRSAAKGIQFCSAAASERDGVQTRLRQGRFRRGADEGAAGLEGINSHIGPGPRRVVCASTRCSRYFHCK